MLETLKFVRGAVSKKDLVPELTHFHIEGGRIEGYNGKLSLSAPIELDIDCCPRAEPFIRAIAACNETAQLHLTAAGKLSVRSGKFRALVETLGPEGFPALVPEGIRIDLDGKLLPALELLEPFIGTDASRPWANGILFDGNSAFATNNVIIVEYWLGYHFPFKVVIPLFAIREMLRIKEEPVAMQLTALSATFHYPGGRWLRTQLVSNAWPNVSAMLAQFAPGRIGQPVSNDFWEALDTIAPFTDKFACVYFEGNTVSSHPPGEPQGAAVEVPDEALTGIYSHKMMSLLQPVAKKIDFSAYPGKVSWYGDNLRGLIMGMRPPV